jgi:hypothetical protein
LCLEFFSKSDDPEKKSQKNIFRIFVIFEVHCDSGEHHIDVIAFNPFVKVTAWRRSAFKWSILGSMAALWVKPFFNLAFR